MHYSWPDCPFCHNSLPVVYWGTNRNKTKRFRCKDCQKTFTEQPQSNRISAEKEALLTRLLQERLSIEAIARATNAAKRTVYNVLKKTQQTTEATPHPQTNARSN